MTGRGWVALPEDEQQDYLAGHMGPFMVRETEHGVEVFDPHTWQFGLFTGAKTCERCGLLPLDYDGIEYRCAPKAEVPDKHNARALSCSECGEEQYIKGEVNGSDSYVVCANCGNEVDRVDFFPEPNEVLMFGDDDRLYVYDRQYVATINTSGYLPWDDDPPTFDTPREAWDYLAGERRELEDRAIEMSEGEDPGGYSSTVNVLETLAEGYMSAYENAGMDPDEGTGSIGADDPTYDGDHPLGLVYSVSEVED